MRKLYTLALFALCSVTVVFAGNPDRQGEAGAYELLLNPFARSAGLGSMMTANVGGAEAMRINPAGIGRVPGLEVTISNMQYLTGTGINMNALGVSAPLGNGQAFGFTLAAMSFGDIIQTTEQSPEGTGTVFSPTFFHIGLGYSKTFDEKISVGAGLRFISESIFNASATGFAIDAGVQYVSGEENEFKLGISLRNIGLGMRFTGDGIATQFSEPVDGDFNITGEQRIADFELPFQLNIGVSYDIDIDADNALTVVGNFTSNAFSRDNIGLGVEYSFRDYFMVRGGYNAETGDTGTDLATSVVMGPSVGATAAIPVSKKLDTGNRRSIFIDYAYRPTRVFDGHHNIGVRLHL